MLQFYISFMKTIIVSVLILFTILNVNAQILNKGFEVTNDSATFIPQKWGIIADNGYEITLDTSIYFSGHSSLRISNKQMEVDDNYASFSQSIKIEGDSLKYITLSVYTRKSNPKIIVNLWCQIRDKNNKMIGVQTIPVDSTINIWQKNSANIILDSDAKKITIGGVLKGIGEAWFDDFDIKDIKISSAPSSSSAKAYHKDFIKIVQQNSLYSSSLNWIKINEVTAKLSGGVQTLQDIKFLNKYVLQKLQEAGDYHSFVQDKANAEKSEKDAINPERAEGKVLANHIGYIYVPGIFSQNAEVNKKFASEIQDHIKMLDLSNDIQGWVIDLRDNNGGNLYPMIAGVGPLLGSGTLGYFPKNDGIMNKKNGWSYEKGQAILGNESVMSIKPFYELKQPSKKIAILINANTGSSGEMLAISFIGNNHARLFGQNSAGYTTGNINFPLSDGDILYLASTRTADRKKKIYTGQIIPDEIVPYSTDKELAIKAATDWIMK